MKAWQRTAIELAFVGTASGATAATIAIVANHIADVGDLLGFIGAFVGAVMTVGGAIWVEERKRLGDDARRAKNFGERLIALGTAAFVNAQTGGAGIGDVQTLLQRALTVKNSISEFVQLDTDSSGNISVLDYWLEKSIDDIRLIIEERMKNPLAKDETAINHARSILLTVYAVLMANPSWKVMSARALRQWEEIEAVQLLNSRLEGRGLEI